ncbi:hypothetical protein [Methylibium petroleiphilum]|uniref:hypothetical protein n=1 Tax=Methylibium petroleiphilum TaxID=105560 RepID=UPI003D266C2B
MRKQLTDTNLTQTMAWIWLGILVAGFVAWHAYRYWRKLTSPPPPLLEPNFTQSLEQRLAKRQATAKRKRRGDPIKNHRRRHP